MRITEVKISVFELPDVTRRVEMFESGSGPNTRWVSRPHGAQSTGHRHVLHVRTDEGVEGVCTVGDVRYTEMTEELLEQVRIIATRHGLTWLRVWRKPSRLRQPPSPRL